MGCQCLRRKSTEAEESYKGIDKHEESKEVSNIPSSYENTYHTFDQIYIEDSNKVPTPSRKSIPNLNSLSKNSHKKSVSYNKREDLKPRNSVPESSKSYFPTESKPRHSVPASFTESRSIIKSPKKSPKRSKQPQSFLPSVQNSAEKLDRRSLSTSKSKSNEQNSFIFSDTSLKSPEKLSQPQSLPLPQVMQSSIDEVVAKQLDLVDKAQYEDIINAPIKTIGQRLPINSLKAVYFYNEDFKKRIDKIKPFYQSWARVRGDGNCYYRAIGVAFMELCCRPSTSPEFIIRYANALKLTARYEVTSVDWQVYNFHYSELNKLCLKKQYNEPDTMIYLQNLLQDLTFDKGMVSEMRKLTAYVFESNRNNPEFIAFIVDSFEFHMTCILTWGQEAEGIEFKCMAEALGVEILHVSVYDSDNINSFTPSYGAEDKIHILYKTGHYDLLYPTEHNLADGFEVTSERFVVKSSNHKLNMA